LPPGVAFNYTPLIDVFMLLTIFFMLVAKFTSNEQLTLLLPQPEESRAQVPRMPARVVINCRLPDATSESASVLYSIGPNPPEALATISEHLATFHRQTPDVKVVIRADRRVRYEHIRAVMREVARNDIDMLNVAAIAGEEH